MITTTHSFLKPCPECASTEGLHFHFYQKEVVVRCGECGQEGPVAKLNEESAREAWNDLPRDFGTNS
jgi:uncharacterized Zn finger protein